ncbi:MAG: hypothetical protein GHCLOJNM_00217 [bacterium]|nr:hypothetical protein [bacterium]
MTTAEQRREAVRRIKALAAPMLKVATEFLTYLDERASDEDPNIKPLRGNLLGNHRFRVGDYRVVYRIDDTARIAYVIRIVHLKEAYD